MNKSLPAFYDLYHELIKKLEELEKESTNIVTMAENAIPLCIHYIDLLKNKVKENGFVDENTEIRFFKFIKPRFVRHYIYYVELIKFHQNLPPENSDAIDDYVKSKTNEINRFFESNQAFYTYYKCRYEFFDKKYFLCSEYDFRLNPDITYIEADAQFKTNMDFLCARILASNRMLKYMQKFITVSLQLVQESQSSKALEYKKLVWTDNTTALDELAYALTYCGAVNHGKASAIDIRKALGLLFSCASIDFYDSGYKIRQRKIKQDKFMQKLRDGFLKWFHENFEK